MSLDGFSLRPLVNELNEKLAGGRIDRIFQPDKHTLIIIVRQLSETLRLLVSVDAEHPRLHITEDIPENPATPPAFCMLLRKHFEDGRIAAVTQHGLDRIVCLHVDVRKDRGTIVTKSLIIELMGKHSNIIFVTDNLVVDAIKRVGYNISRVRQVLPGKEYVYPPGQTKIDIMKESFDTFSAALCENTTMPLHKAIVNVSMGLGPVTAKEIIWRAGLPKDMKVEALDAKDFTALSESMESITKPIEEKDYTPTVVFEDNHLTGIAAFTLEHLEQFTIKTFDTMSSAVEFANNLRGKRRTPETEILQKLVSAELSRLTRKYSTLSTEEAEAELADVTRKNADILMANLHNIPVHKSEVILSDIYSETESLVTITLNPLYSALENAQHYYAKYNKLKRAQISLIEQLTKCREEIAYLESIDTALKFTHTAPEALEIRQELIAAGYLKEFSKKRAALPQAKPLHTTSDGFTIIIGKNNRQNDFVTFKQAQADDLWFHTKDIPGSHVILRTGQQTATDQAIYHAAMCAAYFSKAKTSASVPVDYTKRRYVKKPSGAKPGFVIYEKQTTLYITPDENTVNKLLHQE
jgi:predicted ribosome quality control (RQC) complex YloA/Tae2 family protein